MGLDGSCSYMGVGWQAQEVKALAEVVKTCILERECGIQRNLTHLSGAHTVWYEGAGFERHPLTRSRVGGSPKDQVGLASIVWCRIGVFVAVPALVGWKRMPQRYLRKCPFCGMDEPEMAWFVHRTTHGRIDHKSLDMRAEFRPWF